MESNFSAMLDLTEALLDNESKKLTGMLEAVLNKYIIEPHNAVITRKFIRDEFDNQIGITFEVGFWNTEEERVDFKSDLSGYFFSKKDKLELNYGTCGYYTKDDVYCVRRAMLIADIWKNVDAIEAELRAIIEEAKVRYTQLCNERYEYMHQIEEQKRQEKDNAYEDIINALEVGDILHYDESVSYSYRLFKDHVDTWRVYRIGEKTIKVKSDHFDYVKQIPKESIASLIYNNKLIVTKENK